MTLKATLAERLGRITASDADKVELGEYWVIERPMLLRQVGPAETPVERALRRSGLPAGCGLRRILPDPTGAECTWGLRRKACDEWFQPAEHTLVMAHALQAMRGGRATCAGEEG